MILSEIVSEAGAARVRSWRVGLKGRRWSRKEMSLRAGLLGFSIDTSILAVHITKDSGLVIRHMSLSVPRAYANIPSHPCFVCAVTGSRTEEELGNLLHYKLGEVFVVF